MLRLFLGSWSSCLRMYSQSFLVSSVRGSGSFPTTAVSAASGCTGLLRAFLGAAAFLGVGIGQLELARLGCQAKKSTVLPRTSKKTSRPSVSVTKAGVGDASHLQAKGSTLSKRLEKPHSHPEQNLDLQLLASLKKLGCRRISQVSPALAITLNFRRKGVTRYKFERLWTHSSR